MIVSIKNGVGVTKASSAQVYRRESWVVDMSQAVSSVTFTSSETVLDCVHIDWETERDTFTFKVFKPEAKELKMNGEQL